VLEEERVVDFAAARLVAAGVVGELEMPNQVEVLLDRAGEVALHDLHVVDVVLQTEVGGADLLDDVTGLGGAGDDEAWDVAGVDGLDQQREVGLGKLTGSVAQVADQGGAEFLWVVAVRYLAGQAVELPAAEGGRVLDGAADALPELGDPIRQAGDAAITGRPVTGRQVVEHLLEVVVFEPCLELAGVEVVREQVLNAPEAGLCGGGEAVEEVELREEHAEVGCESWHLSSLPSLIAARRDG